MAKETGFGLYCAAVQNLCFVAPRDDFAFSLRLCRAVGHGS
jgi:hypothetical protein